MFDEIKFTGTVNLGNLVNAVVVLIGSIALYFRIKAELASHEKKTGQKLETSLLKRLPKRVPRTKKKVSPATSDQGDQGNQGDQGK